MRTLNRPVLLSGMLVVAGAALTAIVPSTATAATSGIDDSEEIYAIAVSPAYPSTGVVVAAGASVQGTSNKQTSLFVSQDGGASWAPVVANGWSGGSPVIAIDTAGHEVFFSGTTNGVQRSDDLGVTWTKVGDGGIPSVLPSFAQDGGVAVANGSHDYLVKNGAATPVSGSSGSVQDYSFLFTPATASASRAPVLLSAADPHTGNSVVMPCSLALSCGGPVTTLAGTNQYSGPPTLLPSKDFASDGTVFARTTSGVYKSTDGGATFSPLAISLPSPQNTYPAMTLAPGYSANGPVRTAYVANLNAYTSAHDVHTTGGVFRTTDGGATWTNVAGSSKLATGSLAVATAPDGRLFAAYISISASGSHGSLLCSIDQGNSWSPTCPAVATAHHAVALATKAPVATTPPRTGGNQGAKSGPGAAASAAAGANAATSTSAAAAPGTAQPGDPVSSHRNLVFPLVLAGVALLLLLGSGATRFVRRRASRTPKGG